MLRDKIVRRAENPLFSGDPPDIMLGMRIEWMKAVPLDVALSSPFGIAGGAQDVVRMVLIEIGLEDGTRGFGEASPFPAYNGETREMVFDALERMRPVVAGADPEAWRTLLRETKQASGGVGAAACGVDIAVMDALARRKGVPLHTFFGNARAALETDITVPAGNVTTGRQQAREYAARGARIIKIKVGATDVAEDAARVAAICEAAPAARVFLDGNAGYDRAQALALWRMLAAERIHPLFFEQPVPRDDLEGLRALRAEGLRIAADESACDAAQVMELARCGAADIVNIKLMKSGLPEALDMMAAARRAGLELMIGGMVETTLAMTVSAMVAHGAGGFSYIDLDTPMFLKDQAFRGGLRYEGIAIRLEHIRRGHGVEPVA